MNTVNNFNILKLKTLVIDLGIKYVNDKDFIKRNRLSMQLKATTTSIIEDMKSFIDENKSNYKVLDLSDRFKVQFNSKMSIEQLASLCKKIGN